MIHYGFLEDVFRRDLVGEIFDGKWEPYLPKGAGFSRSYKCSRFYLAIPLELDESFCRADDSSAVTKIWIKSRDFLDNTGRHFSATETELRKIIGGKYKIELTIDGLYIAHASEDEEARGKLVAVTCAEKDFQIIVHQEARRMCNWVSGLL